MSEIEKSAKEEPVEKGKKTQETWHKFRDFFWPMLDGDASYEYEELNDCSFGDEQQLDKAIEIALLAAQREEERRSNVENKASLFIGAFSLAVTILISMIKDYILNMDMDEYSPIFLVIVVFFTSLIIIYLCRAAIYSVKAIERGKYSRIGIPEYLYDKNEKMYKEKLFMEICNSMRKNFDAINKKVDCMVLAQETFKCAVRTAAFFAAALFVLAVIA